MTNGGSGEFWGMYANTLEDGFFFLIVFSMVFNLSCDSDFEYDAESDAVTYWSSGTKNRRRTTVAVFKILEDKKVFDSDILVIIIPMIRDRKNSSSRIILETTRTPFIPGIYNAILYKERSPCNVSKVRKVMVSHATIPVFAILSFRDR
jgi:hypothetical protein